MENHDGIFLGEHKMIKVVGLFRRGAGLTKDHFARRYEARHSPLAIELVPFFSRYTRSFVDEVVIPDRAVGKPAVEFDVVTQLWYDDMDAIQRQDNRLSGEAGRRITEDEEEQFDRQRMLMLTVDERVTPTADLAPPPEDMGATPTVKLMCLLSRTAETSREEFIDYYENRHAPLAVELIRRGGRPVIAGYARNYPVPGGNFQPDHIKTPPPPVDFDAITEIWFWSTADRDAFLTAIVDPALVEAMTDEDVRPFDHDKMRVFTVNEFRSDEKEIAASRAALTAAG